jgi:hypothetical protein
MPTAEKIEEYKSKGALVLIGEHAFKRPTRPEYDRWVDGKVAGSPASVNARQLAQSCIVSPWDEFVATLDVRPSLLLNEVLSAILDLAGVDGEDSKFAAKKL